MSHVVPRVLRVSAPPVRVRLVTEIPPVAAGERCVHCQGTDGLIAGEGAVVCGTCLLYFAHAAAQQPDELTESFRRSLLAAHGDVVKRIWVAPTYVGGLRVVDGHSEWRFEWPKT